MILTLVLIVTIYIINLPIIFLNRLLVFIIEQSNDLMLILGKNSSNEYQ